LGKRKSIREVDEEIRKDNESKRVYHSHPSTRGWLVSRAAYRLLGSPIFVTINCSCRFLAALEYREEAAELDNSRVDVLQNI
jgi:hypothetical protein